MSMGTVCLHEKATIESVLRRNVYLNLYALGDLDDFFWPQTTWYGWRSATGDIEAIALLFSGLELPCLLALCDDTRADSMRALVGSILNLLPVQVYCHLSEPVETIVAERYKLDPHGTHLKMGLLNRSRLDTIDIGSVESLSDIHREEILRLYEASYPGHWFELHMLATGQYVGLRLNGQLVAIAGMHVHSPRYRVAALGNITTHPEHRGRGYGARVTAALCRRLVGSCDHIGLNVKADNTPGIRCYERLGFEPVAEYGAHMATARGL